MRPTRVLGLLLAVCGLAAGASPRVSTSEQLFTALRDPEVSGVVLEGGVQVSPSPGGPAVLMRDFVVEGAPGTVLDLAFGGSGGAVVIR